MNKRTFDALVRHIKRTGLYEPLIVRPMPEQPEHFQILNGRYRARALARLGRARAAAIVWNVDDRQTDMLLATLNRLTGCDAPDKRIQLLRHLRRCAGADQLARDLPLTAHRIEQLTAPHAPTQPPDDRPSPFAHALVFFLTTEQKHHIEHALTLARPEHTPRSRANAQALTHLAQTFLNATKAPQS